MSKKTEKIELRISPEAKARLAALGRDRGQTVSEIIRALVDVELAGLSDAPLAETEGDLDMITPSDAAAAAADRATPLLRAAAIAGAAALGLGVAWSVAWSAAGGGVAIAQTEARIVFAEYDADADGRVTAEEFVAERLRRERVEALDEEDEDHEAEEDIDIVEHVCAEDWERYERAEAEREAVVAGVAAGGAEPQEAKDEDVFSAFDRNGDGAVAFEEVKARFQEERRRRFARLDGDADGRLSREEFALGFVDEELLTLRAAAEISPLCAAAIDARLAERDSEETAREVRIDFALVDENLDGSLSRDEFVNH